MLLEMNWPTPTTAEEGYHRTHRMIFGQVHRMVAEYGGNFDDLLSEAHEFFLRGHNDFMRGTTSTGRVIDHDYVTEIRRHVWRGLFDNMRVRLERNRVAPCEPINNNDHDFAKEVSDFREEDFIAELSPDGAYVAELVLHPPVVIVREAEEKGGTACNYRATVRSYLILMGWSAARTKAAFTEIKEALG